MGGLSLLLLPAVLAAPVAQDPPPVLAHARTPEGRPILLRLQFRKGLSVEGKALPRAFLAQGTEPKGWVPFENLSPDGKRWALSALFPGDQWRQEEVRHVVRQPEVESVWTLAALFTGHGQNYDKLMAENPGLPEKLKEGDTWRIPRSLLSRDLGGTGPKPVRVQPEDELDDEARVEAYRGLLSFGQDAQVSSTIRYPGLGFKSREEISGPSHAAEILTTPPFAVDGESPSAVSVHLRWVLANDLFATFRKSKGDMQKTLFLSFHADSLHPSARGSMIYVPGASLVPYTFALAGAKAGQVAEAKRSARVAFTGREKLQGEARSRQFSEALLTALQRDRIPIHANRPIRNVIYRGRGKWVPAVIRYSTGATKALIEVANLTNGEDAANLKDPDFRERYAAAVVTAIRAYYRK